MKDKAETFVTIAQAYSEGETIQLKMLFDRTGMPYFTRGEQLSSTLGYFYGPAIGPVEFLVPTRFQREAEELLQDAFEVSKELPKNCPACDTPTTPDKLECQECGLFLG